MALKRILLFIILILSVSFNALALDKIPGVKGFGSDTRAAYEAAEDPVIYIVDDLTVVKGTISSDTVSGVSVFRGSLIDGCESVDNVAGDTIDGYTFPANSGKIIVFEVGGTIQHTNDSTNYYSVGPYTEIHGQTAPGGIQLVDISLTFENANDFMIRHVRGRTTDLETTLALAYPFGVLAGSGANSAYNGIFDHLTGQWGINSQLDLWKANNCTGSIYDITINSCLFAEAVQPIYWQSHGKGTLIGVSDTDGTPPYNISLSNNLWTSIYQRTPYAKSSKVVEINNMEYNTQSVPRYYTSYYDYSITVLVGNVTKAGPWSGSRLESYWAFLGFDTVTQHWKTPLSSHSLYAFDNRTIGGYVQSDSTDWDGILDLTTQSLKTNITKVTGEDPSADAPLWPTGYEEIASSGVTDYIVANVGAFPADRDSEEARLITEIQTPGTGGISSRMSTHGTVPTYASNSTTLAIPSSPHVDAGSGYTNLEVWLYNLGWQVEGKTYSNQSPAADSTGVALDANLSWTNSDDANTVNVYFGEFGASAQVSTGSLVSSYTIPGDLTALAVYEWKVETVHDDGTTTEDLIYFTATSGPPVTSGSKITVKRNMTSGLPIVHHNNGVNIK